MELQGEIDRFEASRVPEKSHGAGFSRGERPSLRFRTRGGDPIKLEDYAGKVVVIETASLRSPEFWGQARTMDLLAEWFPEGVFLVLYRCEAFDQKMGKSDESVAAHLAKRISGHRYVILPDEENSILERLGNNPHEVHVFDRDGRVLLSTPTCNPVEVEAILKGMQVDSHAEPEPPGVWTCLRTLTPVGVGAMWSYWRSRPHSHGGEKLRPIHHAPIE